jgi:citrate synthase
MKTQYLMPILLVLSAAGIFSSMAQAAEKNKPGKHWLHEAENDTERFTRLETYLRGFDQPMWEVGHRYEIVYEAIVDKNYELASYHWGKIKTTIKNGYLKRPARKSSADSMFLNSDVWSSLDVALRGSDHKKITAAFSVSRKTCMACHVVEKVPFMNDQKLFRQTSTFSE